MKRACKNHIANTCPEQRGEMIVMRVTSGKNKYYKQMKIMQKILLVPAFLLSALVLQSCGNTEAQTTETGKISAKEEKSVRVEVVSLKSGNYSNYISAIGSIKSLQEANLSTTEGGIVEKFNISKGSFANKDDIVFSVENSVLKASMDAAKAGYELAETNFKMQEKIYKENVNSEFQYLQAKYNFEQAKANYEVIKARYEKTFVKAPFPGILDAKFVEEGEMAAPGVPVCNLINISKVKIVAGIPERYVGQIEKGGKAEISVLNIDGKKFEGKITFVGSSINVDNRTFPVEITVNNPNGLLKPELVAEVKIPTGEFKDVITIPEEVLNRNDDGYLVFVEDNGLAKARRVEIIDRANNRVAVSKGLNDGDKLIVVGYQNLIDGEKVKIVQ